MILYLIPLSYALLKTAETLKLKKAYKLVPRRIHVNGTRGKSSVVRLITAGLQSGEYKVLGKVTGETPSLLGQGGEQTIKRRGPAHIREQIWTLQEAVKRGADTAVLECMALSPPLQATSEKIINSQIGVITGAQPDHLDVMGYSEEEVASALKNTIPRGGHLFLPAPIQHLFQEEAEKRGCTVIGVQVQETPTNTEQPWAMNLALARAVCRHLGVHGPDVEKALHGVTPSPTAFTIFALSQERYAISAFSANDPQTTKTLFQAAREALGGNNWLGLFNHRRDRNYRILSFLPFVQATPFSSLYITGHWHYAFRHWPQATYLGKKERKDFLFSLPPGTRLFGFGNYQGAGKDLLEQIERMGQKWIPKV